MGTFVKVARADELAPGQVRLVELGEKRIALFNLEGSFYALDDECPHRSGPLSEGEVSGDQVTCLWHGSIFSIKTGEVLGPPATEAVACYKVRIAGPDVEVEI